MIDRFPSRATTAALALALAILERMAGH